MAKEYTPNTLHEPREIIKATITSRAKIKKELEELQLSLFPEKELSAIQQQDLARNLCTYSMTEKKILDAIDYEFQYYRNAVHSSGRPHIDPQGETATHYKLVETPEQWAKMALGKWEKEQSESFFRGLEQLSFHPVTKRVKLDATHAMNTETIRVNFIWEENGTTADAVAVEQFIKNYGTGKNKDTRFTTKRNPKNGTQHTIIGIEIEVYKPLYQIYTDKKKKIGGYICKSIAQTASTEHVTKYYLTYILTYNKNANRYNTMFDSFLESIPNAKNLISPPSLQQHEDFEKYKLSHNLQTIEGMHTKTESFCLYVDAIWRYLADSNNDSGKIYPDIMDMAYSIFPGSITDGYLTGAREIINRKIIQFACVIYKLETLSNEANGKQFIPLGIDQETPIIHDDKTNCYRYNIHVQQPETGVKSDIRTFKRVTIDETDWYINAIPYKRVQ